MSNLFNFFFPLCKSIEMFHSQADLVDVLYYWKTTNLQSCLLSLQGVRILRKIDFGWCLASSEYMEVHSHKSQQVQRLDAMAQQGSANPDILTGNLGRISNSLLNCETWASVLLFVSETECFHLLLFSHYERKITSTAGWSVPICLCCPPTREDRPVLHIYREDVCC